MKVRTICRAALSLAVAGFLANGGFLLLDRSRYIGLLQAFAPDGHIASPRTIIIEIQLVFIVLIVLLAAAGRWPGSLPGSWAELWGQPSRLDRVAYFVISVQYVMFYLWVLVPGSRTIRRLYREDALFESLTAICALLASFCLLIGVLGKSACGVRSIKLVLAALVFGFGMEEISWGQRVFGWKTPFFVGQLNYQNESNIHNLINPYLKIIYPVFNLALGLFLIRAARLKPLVGARFGVAYAELIPLRGSMLYGLVFVSLFAPSIFLGGELTEEVFSVFALAYALKLLSAARAGVPDRGP